MPATVRGTILKPDLTPAVRAHVHFNTVTAIAYLPVAEAEVFTGAHVIRADGGHGTEDDGSFEIEVPCTAGEANEYSQAGIVYAVTYSYAGDSETLYVDVPIGGPHWIYDLLVEPPDDLDPPVSSGGTPSGPAGGELTGTYPNPSVDIFHGGSSHFQAQAAAEATAAAALAAHEDAPIHDASLIPFTPDGSIEATNVQAAIVEVRDEAGGGPGGGAPVDATYLVTTADGTLTDEIVVGTTPGGELGGTWDTPTVDATHSGSSHAAVQAAAEATAAGALSSHVTSGHAASAIAFTPDGSIAATDVQAAIQEVRDEAAGGGAPSTVDYYVGTASGGLSAEIVIGTTSTDGHVLRRAGGTLGFGAVDLADSDAVTGVLPDANIASTIARDSEVTSAIAAHESDVSTHGITSGTITQQMTDALTTVAAQAVLGSENKLVSFDEDTGDVNPVTLSDFIRDNLLNDPDASTALTTLGLSAFVKTLMDDANAGAFLTTLGISAFVQTLLDDANAGAFLTTLGISSFAQTILDDADGAAVRTTIGAYGSGSSPSFATTTLTGPLILSATTKTITVVGDTIPITHTYVQCNNTSGGTLALTSTPTIADGTNGQLLILRNTSANQITVQDQGALANSNVRAVSASVVLGPRDAAVLIYDSVVGDWMQVSAAVNVV